MTTTPTVSLEPVAAALGDAAAALAAPVDGQVVEDALIRLCRSAYDVLVDWETCVGSDDAPDLHEPTSWRTPLEELRVQAALAELEMRSAGVPGAQALDDLVRGVSHRIGTARREVSDALQAFRDELSKGSR